MAIHFRKAETIDEKIGCFKVRYYSYLDMGYIKDEDYRHKMLIDKFDSISAIFLAEKEDQIVGTIRLTPPSELGFQMEELFDIGNLKEKCKEKLLWESSKIMVLPGQRYKTMLGLTNIIYLYMKKNNVTDMCYMASPEHAKMYEKLGIVPFGEIKMHSEVNNPAVPLHWDLKNTKEPYKSIFEKGENIFL